jgi:hypothetical protein
MRLARVTQAPSNGDGGSTRTNREDAIGADNSPKTRKPKKLVGGGGSGRYALSRRAVDISPNEAYDTSIDGLDKGEEQREDSKSD